MLPEQRMHVGATAGRTFDEEQGNCSTKCKSLPVLADRDQQKG
jgi:hypothetical protein